MSIECVEVAIALKKYVCYFRQKKNPSETPIRGVVVFYTKSSIILLITRQASE